MSASRRITPGSPRRLAITCRDCGWTDVWEVTLYVLTETGPTQVGTARDCARCAAARRNQMGRT